MRGSYVSFSDQKSTVAALIIAENLSTQTFMDFRAKQCFPCYVCASVHSQFALHSYLIIFNHCSQ